MTCDEHLELTEQDSCSLWWNGVPEMPGERLGCIGQFQAADRGRELVEMAAERLREEGCTLMVGPMDGNTWRSYRFVTEFGETPRFFLEPWNPPGWPGCFEQAGFEPLARYSSSVVPLGPEEAGLQRVERRLVSRGVKIRPLQPERFREELDRLFDLCLAAFSENFLYTPIERAEFLAMYAQIEKLTVPELVLIAEKAGQPVGFVFCVPDHGGDAKTMIVKTLAVHPQQRGLGLGSVLVRRAQANGRVLGFERAIHALQHGSNTSLKITSRNAGRRIREYTLFSKRLK